MYHYLLNPETLKPRFIGGRLMRSTLHGVAKRRVFRPLGEECCGLTLAEDIWNQTHTQVMVGQGAQLTEALIEKLDTMGVHEVPVEVEEDLPLPGMVDMSFSSSGESLSDATGEEVLPGEAMEGEVVSPENTRRTLWERDQLVHDGSVMVFSPNIARRDTISRSLMPLNTEVLTATNEEEALAILAQRLPSVLILDLPLEGHEEWDVLRVLEETQTQHVPVIVISGNNDREMIMQARRHGVKSYLMWPFDPALLRERVARFQGAPAI